MSGWMQSRGFRQRRDRFICSFCGNKLDRPGRLCRACATRNTVKGLAVAVVLSLLGACVYVMIIVPQRHKDAIRFVRESGPGTAPVLTRGAGGWVYYATEDHLVGDVTRHARIAGKILGDPETASAPPSRRRAPPASPTLELVTSTHYGNRVTLTMPKSAFGCGDDPCAMRLAFDQSEPVNYPFTDISTSDATVLMTDAYDQILPNLLHAHAITAWLSRGAKPDLVAAFVVDSFNPKLMR